MKVDELQAGPELDARIAVEVMGMKPDQYPHVYWNNGLGECSRCEEGFMDQGKRRGTEFCAVPPAYSTDMGDAWRMVLHLQSGRWYFRMDSTICGGWTVTFHDERACVRSEPQPMLDVSVSRDKELPLALCVAALRAVGSVLGEGLIVVGVGVAGAYRYETPDELMARTAANRKARADAPPAVPGGG